MDKNFIVNHENNYEGKRLDIAVSLEVESLSRSRAQALIKSGDVLVNNRPAKANAILTSGDTVEIILGEPTQLDILPEDIPLEIVYEDKDLAVINKPKGMVVHPAPGHTSGTLVNGLMHRFAHELSGINGVMRPGIVHRIDKDTSGLLVIAKNDAAHQSLSQQLAERAVTREYIALAMGHVKDNSGTVDKPIGRHPIHRKRMAVIPNGRTAITHYTVLERFDKPFKCTLLRLRLTTGRTHQIRVHMASIGHPILGDEVYGSAKLPAGFVTNGQALHAKTVGFVHPSTGEFIEFTSQLPSYFQSILHRLN